MEIAAQHSATQFDVATGSRSFMKGATQWWRTYGVVLAVFVIVEALTSAFFLGDTVAYAAAIERHEFHEFGHLLWYPVGWLAHLALTPLSQWLVGTKPLHQMIWALMALNWLAGLVCVLLQHALLRHFCRSPLAIWLGTLGLLFAQAFLNFTQSGASYIPGLALWLLGFCLLVVKSEQGANNAAIWAGVALAGSVALWVPYLWAVPVVIVAPRLLYGVQAARRNRCLLAFFFFGFMVGTLFLTSAWRQGITNVEGLRAWIAAASHGADSSGAARTALGLARSFLNLGNDGLLFKRFLVKDPFNPVTLTDLIWASLWKLAFFYLAIGALCWALITTRRGRTWLAVWLCNAVPVIGFGLMWQGGDMERYLALMPVTFLSLGIMLEERQGKWLAPLVAVITVAVMTGINFLALLQPRVHAREQAALARIHHLLPQLRPQSALFTVMSQDDVWAFGRNFPFHPLNGDERLQVICLIEPGTQQATHWRPDFAHQALKVWRAGGDIWVSKQVQAAQPKAAWYWAEGADKRVTWSQLHDFFSGLTFRSATETQGEDSFVLLLPTPSNQQRLAEWARQAAGYQRME